MRMTTKMFAVAICFLSSHTVLLACSEGICIWYDQAAKNWNEATPIGNGRLGAMVFGGVSLERFQLNEATLYSMEPEDIFDDISVSPEIELIRQLIEEGKYAEADEWVRQEWLGRHGAAYQPVGDLYLQMLEDDVAAEYRRSLELESGIHRVTYKQNGVVFHRETYASHVDQVIVIRLTADQPGQISFDAYFRSPHPTASQNNRESLLSLTGRAPSFVTSRNWDFIEERDVQYKYPKLYNHLGERWPDAKQVMYGEDGRGRGMQFEAALESYHTRGSKHIEDGRLKVRDADSVVLILSMATSFNGFEKSPSEDGLDPAAINDAILSKVSRQNVTDLMERHVTDFGNLFNRVHLELGTLYSGSDKPTNILLADYAEEDRAFLNALLFHFGRYLMISGSREGGEAMNLQGIWNDDTTPPWSSSYTMNINTQMNYWPAEVTNLAECHVPLLDFVKGLAVNGQTTAREMFGYGGWVAFHNSSIWRKSWPNGNHPRFAFWPMSPGWYMSHFWEHYQYSGDESFLREEAYPLMKSSVNFYLNWLVEDENGFLVTPVSTSPENSFLTVSGQLAGVSQGSTMDMAILRELFYRTADAADILEVDSKLARRIRDKADRMLPYQIGRYGQLMEWAYDFEEADPEHRHLSHLYGLYPGDQIGVHTPELAEASRVVLERRGSTTTGWSMGWKINLWARLRDGTKAQNVIDNLFNIVREDDERSWQDGGLYPNLLVAHPPFQIDGNFGYTAGVAELLMQSQNEKLVLLPALPASWASGKVSGLRARGGFEVNMHWQDMRLLEAKIISRQGHSVEIEFPNEMRHIDSGQTGKRFSIPQTESGEHISFTVPG